MMDWNNLRQRWQSAADPADSRDDVEAVRTRDRKLRGTVRRRDFIETGVALIVMPCFLWTTWNLATSDKLLGAAFALFIALWAGFVPLRLWHTRRRMPTPHPERPLREYLDEERAAMLAQARMLESIWLWYLGPCVVGILGLVFSIRTPTLGTWVYVGIVVAFCVLVGWANHVAARKHFRAMADDIGRQIQALNKENGV